MFPVIIQNFVLNLWLSEISNHKLPWKYNKIKVIYLFFFEKFSQGSQD